MCKIGNLEAWKFELWMLPIWRGALGKYVVKNIDFIREITGSKYSELIEETITAKIDLPAK